MTIVSNDPIWWPTISYFREWSCFAIASFIVVLYDWALTFGQEFELIWRQRWSLMTVLYLTARYAGIPYSFVVAFSLPSVSVTDAVSMRLTFVENWIGIVVNAILGVIMIVRLQAMYQRSRRMLIFLVVFFLTVQIACVVLNVIATTGGHLSGEEYVLSGAHLCGYDMEGDAKFLLNMTWVFGAVWEALALILAVWIAIKHFRELPRPTRWTIGGCFTILMKTHVFYFASFAFVSFLQIIGNFTKYSAEAIMYDDVLQIIQVVQMFVLGPRLILGLREYHAKLVANSDEGIGMESIVFEERIHITTGGGV